MTAPEDTAPDDGAPAGNGGAPSSRSPGGPRTLVVTNDFPPRAGGIQSFVHQLVLRQPPGSVVVYASDYEGSAAFDAAQPFPVIRHPTGLLLPIPSARARILHTMADHQATAVWFGAAAPLAMLAPALRAAGARRIVASTHGHEIGWAMLPGARQVLQRIGRDCDVITYLADYTGRRLEQVLPEPQKLVKLPPGVDLETFTPGMSGSLVRERHGLGDRPVIVCVSRLVPRKGQDMLIRAMPVISRRVPRAVLLLVGRGPYEGDLRRLAARTAPAGDVLFTGAVADGELAAHYAAGNVFAMPCRTRRAGMDVEGLGIVYLEASAAGLPVVAGDSGGAPDAVRDGETGYVVDGRDVDAIAARVGDLLADPVRAAEFGRAGRAWVERDWRWDVVARRLTDLLAGP